MVSLKNFFIVFLLLQVTSSQSKGRREGPPQQVSRHFNDTMGERDNQLSLTKNENNTTRASQLLKQNSLENEPQFIMDGLHINSNKQSCRKVLSQTADVTKSDRVCNNEPTETESAVHISPPSQFTFILIFLLMLIPSKVPEWDTPVDIVQGVAFLQQGICVLEPVVAWMVG